MFTVDCVRGVIGKMSSEATPPASLACIPTVLVAESDAYYPLHLQAMHQCQTNAYHLLQCRLCPSRCV